MGSQDMRTNFGLSSGMRPPQGAGKNNIQVWRAPGLVPAGSPRRLSWWLFFPEPLLPVLASHRPRKGQRDAPLRFLVHRRLGVRPQGANAAAIHRDGGGRELGAGRFVQERHELLGEAGHGAANANAADAGAAADAGHPAALAHIDLDDRAPAALFDDALPPGLV